MCDGAPPYDAPIVSNFVKGKNRSKWIGHKSSTKSLNFIVWNQLKSVIYTKRPHT